MKYSNVCDEQLILCYRQNSLEAYQCLLERKHRVTLPLLKKYVNQCSVFGADMNDIYAIFLESFHKAIRRYVFEMITFQTYFLKVLNRDLAGFYRTISNPNKPCNNCLSLDQEVTYDSNLTFHDVLTTSSQKNDARNYANVSSVLKLLNKEALTNKDEMTRRIILLKAAGYSVSEIASIVNLKVASVRRRINNFYENELGDKIKKCLM
ncbi:MAG: hypothetical protein GX816_03455 [Erysipelotrichia bacterium]|jgi:DNA-directed RNA polymerase specialized sigma24 family protein|nr:hypothetical protein [Erysipelotrichia bacterium]